MEEAGRQSGIQMVAVFHVLDSFTFWKGFPRLEIGEMSMHCGLEHCTSCRWSERLTKIEYSML